ncbi:hypothetical protein ISCGN_001464 [Ixodes scapularis]
MFRKNGEEIPSNHVLLIFERHNLPKIMIAGYLNCRIRNPQRCFLCQRSGHGSRSCRGTETCANCGSHDNVADVCEGTVSCANCKNFHPAYSRSYSLWRQEKKNPHSKRKKKISYPESKQRLSFLSKSSYSDAVRRGPPL